MCLNSLQFRALEHGMSTLITAGNGMGKMSNVTHELQTNAAELNPDPNRIPNTNPFGIYIPQFTHGHILPEPNYCCA